MYMKFSKAAGPFAGGDPPPRVSATAPAGMSDAEKAEFDRLKSEAAHKGIELQRLHEQLAFVEEVNAANKRLLDDHHRAAASGYFISHRASAFLILGALGAAVYAMRRSHLRRQKLKLDQRWCLESCASARRTCRTAQRLTSAELRAA